MAQPVIKVGVIGVGHLGYPHARLCHEAENALLVGVASDSIHFIRTP